MTKMRFILLLVALLFKTINNEVILLRNDSTCEGDECSTIRNEEFSTISEFITGSYVPIIVPTEKEKEEVDIKVIQKNFGNDPKLKNLDDEFNVKIPNLIGLDYGLNKTGTHTGSSILKAEKKNDSSAGKINETTIMENKTEMTTFETSTQLNISSTTESRIDSRPTKSSDIYYKLNHSRNQAEICFCDLIVNECDINCCCDLDCSENMKSVFTTCLVSAEKVNSQFCLNSVTIFKTNLNIEVDKNGLFCVVRNNFHPHVTFREEMLIDNVPKFDKRISRKKFFSYSPLKFDGRKIQKIPYKFGDLVWSASGNDTLPFVVPKQGIDMQCKFTGSIYYLRDYETECFYTVPDNKEKCVKSTHLEMNYFLRTKMLIKSPALLISYNSSEKVCNNKTCIPIATYTCKEDSNFSSCVLTTPKRLLWNKTCTNLVSSVEYHIYHNGTDGVKEARAYFTLKNFKENNFIQKIKLKFFWAEGQSRLFKRSGNPGYIIGKPVMSGRKVYSSNETMLKKEAIELSYNPEDWLTVVGNEAGMCSTSRRPIDFGENAIHRCSVNVENYDFRKGKCIDMQEIFLNLLLGKDYADLKASNNLNKFVATFGNSEVENTGDWVQVIVESPVKSAQLVFSSDSDNFVCKNVVTDLMIDVAYAKVGSFDRPQNKILGVKFRFGCSRDFIYYFKPSLGNNKIVKLSTYVNFIDLTREPNLAFAETPGFEAKLPHDFFYPFFSGSYANRASFCVVLIAFTINIALMLNF